MRTYGRASGLMPKTVLTTGAPFNLEIEWKAMAKKDLAILIASIDVSSREKRRQATSIAIGLLEHICAAEEANIGRFPENFQDGYAFAKAEESFEIISDVIAGLGDAYY